MHPAPPSVCALPGALNGKRSRRSAIRSGRGRLVRWDLKEAAGKTLARRTETVYEAARPDEEAYISKVRYLSGRPGRICGGHKREGECALPGEVRRSVHLD